MEGDNIAKVEPLESAGSEIGTLGFYERIFFSALSGMQRGSLRILFPDGGQRYLGNPNSSDPSEFHHAILQVKDRKFFKKLVLYGDLGLAESYMDGDWDTDDIRAIICWFLLNIESTPSVSGSNKNFIHLTLMNLGNRLLHLFRNNSVRGSKKNISEHYDLGNDFYKKFLDPTMTYSCAYFADKSKTLEEAQIAKIENLCKKLKLKASDHLLEIGTGWGAFSTYAAKNYGCKVTSYTISEEQYKFAKAKISDMGLEDKIEVRLEDYRKVQGSYDKIVTVEMLEAVGHEYFEDFFRMCHRVLKKDGLMAHQIITCPDSRYESFRKGVDFIQKHIFPGSLLPSIARINEAINKTGDMFLHELEDIGKYYDQTLMSWHKGFEENLPAIRSMGYDESFLRKWRYYFSYCAAAFHMRNISVVQVVYTRPNNLGLNSQ
ncbi:class I SAM-dependent methyltransferase [Leptospira selangorensis]|uniref:Class I SAM-dependent methyltransferase n=1 Tax=Leptospira selangorensis TaxID=2484982 RepID=A0A4V3JDK4_9LEPT|nr:cyclopropane-fatty-acyl-phospholipid synthase family protein [Leptospira selangorensis]TGK10431.1 class I SAM-dependent methyltransferase [Leptospira selangorensis]TGM13288.1 class I SAM-dependent methyltransferase [Leptospira selangorensis]TGM22370.1 class I SAM-dependent methyltransferase [Leptospira selangorensis]